ncbi:MAG: flagellar basal body L-ring protein FlgH [Terricaulis sp.]
MKAWLVFVCILLPAISTPAFGEDLYAGSSFADIAADRRAEHVGDILTVVVYQNAEARNRAQNVSRQGRSFDGSINAGDLNESAELSLEGSYRGEGEVRRSESFITQISVSIEEVLPNGDFIIGGEQSMRINGEHTMVAIRGRVRPADIASGNRVLSTQIADAEIRYDGQGFVSRNARPNLIHRLFSLLGLGG